MILDILTVLFFVLGFVLILQMIGERRRDVLHGPYVTKEAEMPGWQAREMKYLPGRAESEPSMASRRPQHDPILLDRDDRRVERVVLGVAQHELKGMLTGRKFDGASVWPAPKWRYDLSWAIGSLGLRGSFTSISKW